MQPASGLSYASAPALAPQVGGTLHLRPIRAADASGLQQLVAALSPLARRRRFHFGINQLTRDAAQALATPVAGRAGAWVVTERDALHGDSRLIADARWALADEAPLGGAAEFAVMVSDSWQRRGVGRVLLMQLLADARARRLQVLYGDALSDNPPMIALAHSLGAAVRRHPTDARLTRMHFALTPLH